MINFLKINNTFNNTKLIIPSIYLLINVAVNREADKLHSETLENVDISMQFSIITTTLSSITFWFKEFKILSNRITCNIVHIVIVKINNYV